MRSDGEALRKGPENWNGLPTREMGPAIPNGIAAPAKQAGYASRVGVQPRLLLVENPPIGTDTARKWRLGGEKETPTRGVR